MTALLTLRDVTKSFGGVRALRGVSFDLQPGEIHALVGENGAGKSTLVKIVTGALSPEAGTLDIGGQRIDRADPLFMRACGVAPIYQQPALCPDLTVAENLALRLERGRSWRRIDWPARRRRAAALLAQVGAAIDVEMPSRSLRMAEQQLVEIAGALGADARILVMDEPTAALSDRETARLFGLLRDLRAKGAGIVYISHRLEEVETLADRVSVLRDGELVAARRMTDVTRAELIRLMVGREIQAVYPTRVGHARHEASTTPRQIGAAAAPANPPAPAELDDVVLGVEGIGCAASGVRDVTLRVRAGEIVGLAGLVGAGRTELARVLFGLTPADRGVIRIDGRAAPIASTSDAVRHGLAYVPEDRRAHGVVAELSVAANVTLASLRRLTRHGLLDVRRERTIATDYVRRFAIKTSSVDAPVGTLSGGNQQKVALARWLAVSPRVLILDEPTQGVDIGAKAEIHRLIIDLAARGLAILLISSELPEILGLSDRIAVMRGGTIAGTLDRDAATPDALLTLALGHAPDAASDREKETKA
jgi:rhamnose transport system ATP-binding protein